jgi:hypothetical protein
MPMNPAPSSHPTEVRSFTGSLPRVDHRDGAGHLDPAYEKRLRGRMSRHARRGEDREIVGKTWRADSIAQESAQEFVMTVTSGQDAGLAMLGAVTPEENGGPFVETRATTEFAYGPDRSNPTGAAREPFPKS